MTENSRPLRVLIIEDSEDDTELLLKALKRGGYDPSFAVVATAATTKAALHGREWDVVLSDFRMHGFNGMEALGILKAAERDIPFILVSGTIGEELAVDILKAGASDYVMKGNLVRLTSAIERAMNDAKLRAESLRVRRAYEILSRISGAIIRIRNRDELFNEVARIATSEGGFVHVHILKPNADMIREIYVDAHNGVHERLFEHCRSIANSDHPAAIALRTGLPVIVNDVGSNQRIPNRATLTRDGINALAVLPIVVQAKVVAAVCLWGRAAGIFNAGELRLLVEMASNLSLGLDLIDKEQKLNHLAYFDSLTGLPNQTRFQDQLQQKLLAARGSGIKLALAVTHLERFKTVNDSLGRTAGDDILKQFSARLTNSTGRTVVGRIASDQFAAILENPRDEADVEARLQDISRACFTRPFKADTAEILLSAKTGVAMFPEDGSDVETLFSNADEALLGTQRSGERISFHMHRSSSRASEQLVLENQLRRALERNEFVLHYQPKVDLVSRRVVGLEALIRWRSPDLGLVSPLRFVPFLEETGLILEVGAWVLSQAVADQLAWSKMGFPSLRIAVNVSAIQLRRRDYVEGVKTALMGGTPPTGIDLEITESAVMEDILDNVEKLNAIRGLGACIAIDDFGTGYSSLAYLTRLPVQALKIDRSFIEAMLNDADTTHLVATIISLAHSLRLKVIAEGVETEDQARLLGLLLCDEIQGFLVSRPLPFEQMTEFLTASPSH